MKIVAQSGNQFPDDDIFEMMADIMRAQQASREVEVHMMELYRHVPLCEDNVTKLTAPDGIR